MKLIPKPEHSSLAWLQQRQVDENGNAILGGSDAPALMEASPYKTRADLYHDKVTPPQVAEFNMAFHRGNLLERPLIEEASRVLKVDLHTPDVMYRDGRWNINSDAVDNATAPSINIECKTTTRYTVTTAHDLPEEWKWQGWAQMLVLDVPVFFSVLDARQNLAVVELERNDYAIDQLIYEGERFCAAVDSRDFLEFLDEMTAEQIASIVRPQPTATHLPPHALALVESLERARATKKEAEREEKEARDALAQLLLEHEVGLVDGTPVISWKEQAGKRSVDLAALRAEHPDLVARFEREGTPYRVMRISNRKKETK